MMKISGDFDVRCGKCGNLIHFYADDFDEPEPYSYERNMGTEIDYDFYCEKECEVCGNSITAHITGSEYPEGAFDYSSAECDGGEFIREPSAEMDYLDYEFDLNYTYEAAEDYLAAQSAIEQEIDKIMKMSDRDFEYYVAGLFENMGYSVRVTQQTRDGGADIIATKGHPVPFTMLIECKHWSNNVGVSVVRSLYGVQMAKKANKSILVTSSRFTPDARRFAETQENMMSLMNLDDLIRLVEP